ncbi:MAG: hypothetical protein E6527_14750 [Mixta calida]|nr:hypothetical protein [Mixta calida]
MKTWLTAQLIDGETEIAIRPTESVSVHGLLREHLKAIIALLRSHQAFLPNAAASQST